MSTREIYSACLILSRSKMDQQARWRAGWRPHETLEHVNIPQSVDWIPELRRKLPWVGEGLVVLSLFDGMGGCWQALKELGIPVKKGYSCEINDFANAVVKARFPDVVHLGSVTAVTREMIGEDVDLIVGGFPCQDLSRMGNQRGLHGARSGLFFHIPRCISLFKPKWFLVENVRCRWQDQAEVSKYLLGVLPMELDAEEISPQQRNRNYWTNLPLPPNLPGTRDRPETAVQHFTHGAIAAFSKMGTVLTTNSAANTSRVALKSIYDTTTEAARYLHVEEIEAMMGYPPGYTKILYGGRSARKAGDVFRFPSAKKSAPRRLFEGGGNEEEGAGGPDEPAVKRLKLEEDGKEDATGGSENGGVRQGENRAPLEEEKEGIISLSSDDDNPVEGDASKGPGGQLAVIAAVASAVVTPGIEKRALAVVRSAGEAGGSGLSVEEKSRGESPAYSLRVRKVVDYSMEHVEVDERSPRRSSAKKRINRTPVPRVPTPAGQAQYGAHELRWALLGNSFVVPCIAYMLSPLLSAQLRTRAERIVDIPAPAENDACLFQVGEVWALYNEETAPNWYARISHVDVTKPEWSGRKKIPANIQVHYQFYEYTPGNKRKQDSHCPLYGVGRLQLSPETNDSSDRAFSHQVAPEDLGGGQILVYPKEGEVWVVKDLDIPRFKMHVFIAKSELLDRITGDFECTIRILVLQPRSTSKITLYRMVGDERVVSGRRMVFSYQVPYFYKNEAGLLYVEPQYDHTRTTLKRMRDGEEGWPEEELPAEDEELEGRGIAELKELLDVPQIEFEQNAPVPTDHVSASQAVQLSTEGLAENPSKETPSKSPAEDRPASRKGKEKVDSEDDVRKDDSDKDVSLNEEAGVEVAGALPAIGSPFCEQRAEVKSRDIHGLMRRLPELYGPAT